MAKVTSATEKWFRVGMIGGGAAGYAIARPIDPPPYLVLGLSSLFAVGIIWFCVHHFFRKRREKREDRARALAEFVHGRNVQ